jgi:plastocyanin
MRKGPVIAGVIVCVLLAPACGSNDDATPSSAATTGSTPLCDKARATDESELAVVTVAMADLMYLPGCFIARSRDQVLRLKNADHTTHTFTVDGTDVDVEVPAGTTVKVEGDAAIAGLDPGTYPFHCRIHTPMTGVMIVR